MGKVHDKIKGRDMKKGAVIQSRDLAGASIIQQTGMDKPDGMHRMFNVLLHKLDPEGKGVLVTLADIQAYGEAAMAGRQNTLVHGQYDAILFKLCTNAEMANAAAHAEEIFKAAGLGTVQ
jgi:hypothetical protein